MLELAQVDNRIEQRILELNKELAGVQRIACIHEQSVRLIEISREIRIASAELRLLNKAKRAVFKASQEKLQPLVK